MLHVIPLSTAGWALLIPCLAGGITSVLMHSYEPSRALETAAAEKATRMFVTPSQLADLMDDPACERVDLSSLRMLICGTAPLPASLASEVLERLGPVLYHGYGLAEVLPPLALLRPDEFSEDRPCRSGRVVPGVEVRVAPEGTLHIKSPTQSAGYWNRPDLTEAAFRDGYFDTGDVGFFDEEGYLNILGRQSDRVEGVAPHPREIEEVIAAHPAVKECALVDVDGAAVLAYSTRRGRQVSDEELRDLLAGRLPEVSLDRIIGIEGDLPRTGAGKIVRSALAARV
jgi:fatty-acyl-CoA synthase